VDGKVEELQIIEKIEKHLECYPVQIGREWIKINTNINLAREGNTTR